MTPEVSCADYPGRIGGWRVRATGCGQLLDMRHLMHAWGNVDRGIADLRQ